MKNRGWKIFCCLSGFLFLTALFLPPISFEKVRQDYRGSEKVLLDRKGQVLQEWRYDSERRRLDWTSLGDIAPTVKDAVLHIEDRRFYRHPGVDPVALLSIPYAIIRGKKLRGTSTITMQLAGLINPELRPGRPSLFRKLQQMAFAIRLDSYWSKDEILEAYLNLLSFRGEWQGIRAASQGMFAKAPHGIDRAEALILASLIANPNARSKAVARRACLYASKKEIRCDELKEIARAHLDRPLVLTRRDQAAPHVARFFPSAESTQRSSLDRDIQVFAQKALNEQMAVLKQQNVQDAAILLVNHRTGEVLSYIGSSASFSAAPEVDGIQGLRQAGSTLKPFLYAKAFEQRLLQPDNHLIDEPTQIATSSGIYAPQNYDRSFRGLVSVREALADSLNIPAIRTIDLLGVDSFYDLLLRLGFTHMRDRSRYGHSLALGAVDISLWELVHAYAVLARKGRDLAFHLHPHEEEQKEGKQILSENASLQVAAILSDKNTRSGSFGLDNPLATPYWSAVKTGTSKDMRDNWCLGFSETYTLGVWVGNFDGAPMWNVSGISGAAPIWRQVMDQMHRQETSRPPQWPIVPESPKNLAQVAVRPASPRIKYPLDRMLLAFDPDIPKASQVLFFESAGDLPKSFTWHLDGKIWPKDHIVLADLKGGMHRLEIRDSGNQEIDAVRFELRGKESEKEKEWKKEFR